MELIKLSTIISDFSLNLRIFYSIKMRIQIMKKGRSIRKMAKCF